MSSRGRHCWPGRTVEGDLADDVFE